MKSKGKQKKSGELEVDVELKKIGDRIRFLRIKEDIQATKNLQTKKILPGLSLDGMKEVRI